ncbi:MAG: hypothetical protein KKH28_15375 [Elusimicrobia bacterium]|nr:hypothetical protein [Elusimicrobiota bacterium]
MAGNNLSGTYPNPSIASLPAISGANLTNLTAANIAAGSLLNTVIASSIAVNGVYPAAVQAGTYGINITGTAVGAPPTGVAGNNLSGTYPNPSIASLPAISGANLTAANIAAGDLAVGVIASSIAVNGVYPAAVQAGTYGINITGTSAGAAPTGAAGGVLNGTYPNPGLATSQTAAVTWSGAQTFTSTANFPGSGIWTASGKVGVGTTNPRSAFEVAGLIYVDTGNYSSAIGVQAGNVNSGVYNNFLGYRAGYSNTTGSNNNLFGYQAGYTNTIGHNNNFLGNAAGYSNLNGHNNNFIGSVAGQNNTTGVYNNFLGASSGWSNTIGSYNNFLGANAGNFNAAGGNNNFLGYNAGFYNQTGSSNTAIGDNAGYGVSGQSYNGNTLAGYKSGYGLSTGSRNILLGWQAGDSLTTGSDNIIIGYNADAPGISTSSFLNIGNAIYGNLSNGNVGIGTTAPGRKLDVRGGVNLVGAGGDGGMDIYYDESYQKRLHFNVNSFQYPGISFRNTATYDWPFVISPQYNGGDPYFEFFNWGTWNRIGLMAKWINLNGNAYISGNVGIGTTSPRAKFEVTGGSSIFRGSNSNSAIAGFTDAGGNYRIVISTSGNVGIGTAAPGAKLDVAGSVNAQRYNKVTMPNAYTSAAIQAAIDTVGNEGGGIVFLPAGTYAVSATITLKPKITLQGAGYNTILDGTGFAGGTILQLPSGSPYNNIYWHIKDLRIQGSSTGGGSASDAATGLNLPYGTGPGKISDVWFDNLYSYGIYNSFANSVEISHCNFRNYSGTALYYSNTWHQRIIGCEFFSPYATYGIQTNSLLAHNNISNNIFDFLLSGANAVTAIYTHSGANGYGNIIANNVIRVIANSASNVYGIDNTGINTNIIGNYLSIVNSGAGGGVGILSSGNYCNVSANNSKGSKTANSISGTGTETGGANIDAP